MSEQALPLVVLHGWGHDSSYWKAFAEKFHSREVILIDLPGFGAEPLVSADWGVPEYADWVELKISGMVQGPFVLLGHSFGGRIAAVLAARHMPGLSALILYGAPLLYRPSLKTRLKQRVAGALRPFVPKKVRSMLIGNSELLEADERGMGAIFRRAVSFDQTTTLPQIAVPTLMLWGAGDTSAPLAQAREAKVLIPGATLEVLAHAGHNAHLDKPDLFYGTVSRFLQTV